MDHSLAFVLGPMPVLVSFALILYGTFTSQVYFYWKEYKHDPARMKYWVFSIWTLETAHSACCIIMLYTYFITNFGNREVLEEVQWSVLATIFLEIIIVGLTQAFYIYRIWRLSQKSFLVAMFPAVALFAREVLGLALAGVLSGFHKWADFGKKKGTTPLLNIALSCGVLVDVMTTAMLAYFLYSRRPKFSSTKHLVDSVMFYSLNTGGLTIVFSLFILLTYNFMNESLIWVSTVEVVSKLYACSMLVMLNARRSLRSQSDHESAPIPLHVWSRSDRRSHVPQDGVRVEIFKETTTEQANANEPASEEQDDKTPYALA